MEGNSAARIESFADFWPYYVRQHQRRTTRILHAIGSLLALACLFAALSRGIWILALAPLLGYGFAWYAHFFVEHNRPATFGHPFYSLGADYVMLFLMIVGRMEDEVKKHSLSL